MWMTSCTGSAPGGFWKKWESWNFVAERKSWVEFCLGRRWLTFACSPWPCVGWHMCWGGADGKVSIERWYLSPYVKKPFDSKVIKSFVSELRSCKCFSCFRIPMFYVYMLWTFYVRFPYSFMGMLQLLELWE